MMQGCFLFLFYFVLACYFVYTLKQTKLRTWWVKVDTVSPRCRYYFGPFDSPEEAQAHHRFYLEDLAEEGATGIQWAIEQGYPRKLTIEW